MQKLDFIRNLEEIVNKLKSREINQEFIDGFEVPNNDYPYSRIRPLLFISKSGYDQIRSDQKYKQILECLNADDIYEETNLSELSTILITGNAYNILLKSTSTTFYNFHNSLIKTLYLSKKVLLNKVTELNFQKSIEDGIVIFQIIIEQDGLETEKYIKIFTALQELIETLSKIFEETEQKSEIILLDSGSDTNVGIRTGIETAGSLFLIFKEIWDFITNFRYYKQDQKNKALLDSLSIRTEISKKVKEGIITEEEGKQYVHIIRTRTNELIGMKVLPKQIVLENSQIENKKLLMEFEGFKMLTSGEQA